MQDVEELAKNGISVMMAVNVQHLESLHDQVLKITSTNVTERIPDQLLKLADEVVNVDLTVGELRARLEGGKIYDAAKVPTALANFFQAENHDRIFQRFAQIPDKTGYRGGSVLGLSIAREFITTQGGRLWVEGELGSGSRFCFTLPVA